MERMQIYLTEEQKQALATLAKEKGEKQSVLIRCALDQYIAHEQTEKAAQQRDFWAKAESQDASWAWDDYDDPHTYVETLRATADTRLKSLQGGLSDQNQNNYEDKDGKS